MKTVLSVVEVQKFFPLIEIVVPPNLDPTYGVTLVITIS